MPAIRLTPADLAKLGPDARQAAAKALADHLGAAVDLGDAHAEPVAPQAPEAPEEASEETAPAPAGRPWLRPTAIAVLAFCVPLAAGWAWLARPMPHLPPLPGEVASTTATAAKAPPEVPGQVAVKHVTAPPASATPATTQAAPQKAQASGDSVHATATAGGGKSTAPTTTPHAPAQVAPAQQGPGGVVAAQVLPNPPAPGATICKAVGGVFDCRWVAAG